MITIIQTTHQYGKAGFCGINHHGEHDEITGEQFAHSFGDAEQYVRALPLMADAEVTDPSDGRKFFHSQWRERDEFVALYRPELDGITHERVMIGIAVRETITV